MKLLSRKKTPTEQLRTAATAVLNVVEEQVRSTANMRGLTGVRAVATGAAIYTAGGSVTISGSETREQETPFKYDEATGGQSQTVWEFTPLFEVTVTTFWETVGDFSAYGASPGGEQFTTVETSVQEGAPIYVQQAANVNMDGLSPPEEDPEPEGMVFTGDELDDDDDGGGGEGDDG